MDKHKCQLCYKNFPDGQALGVHMKSHMMNSCALKSSSNEEQEQLYEAYNASKQEQIHFYSSSSSDDDEEEKQENQKKGAVDSGQSTATGSTVLEDGGTEEVPSKDILFSRVFKRARNSKTQMNETNEHSTSLSSISELTPEENGAYILMMLSRDSWDRVGKRDKEIELPKIEKNDNSQDSNVVKKSKVKGKYKCESCNMLFKSYQALGGHNAKHKRIEEAAAAASAAAVVTGQSTAAAVEEKTFECPYCQKVFASGQALGGHKRSHFSYGTFRPTLRNGEKLEIKLNRPLSASHDQTSESESSAASGEEN